MRWRRTKSICAQRNVAASARRAAEASARGARGVGAGSTMGESPAIDDTGEAGPSSPAASARGRAPPRGTTHSAAASQRTRCARPWHARQTGPYAAGGPVAGPSPDSLARERRRSRRSSAPPRSRPRSPRTPSLASATGSMELLTGEWIACSSRPCRRERRRRHEGAAALRCPDTGAAARAPGCAGPARSREWEGAERRHRVRLERAREGGRLGRAGGLRYLHSRFRL